MNTIRYNYDIVLSTIHMRVLIKSFKSHDKFHLPPIISKSLPPFPAGSSLLCSLVQGWIKKPNKCNYVITH